MPSKVTTTTDNAGFRADFQFSPLQYLRVLYLSFLRGLFSASPPGLYHWEPGEGSEIYIEDDNPIHPDAVGNRPAISLTRGPVKFYSLGIGDLLRSDSQTGKRVKAVLIPGVMSINCCSKVPIESENIAWTVAEYLWLLREQLMGTGLFFEIGRQPQISPPSPAEGLVANDGGEEWYCTVVSSPFQFPRQSQRTPLNQQIVENMQLQISMAAHKAQCGGALSSPNGADFPVQVHTCPPESYWPEASDAHGRAPDPAGVLPPPPPKSYHPLNPSVEVVVRSARRQGPCVRPPSMGGRSVLSRRVSSIPIADACVEQSQPDPPISTKV